MTDLIATKDVEPGEVVYYPGNIEIARTDNGLQAMEGQVKALKRIADLALWLFNEDEKLKGDLYLIHIAQLAKQGMREEAGK